jgi:hypothetical protein
MIKKVQDQGRLFSDITRTDDFTKVKRLFRRVGLAFPFVPEELASQMKKLGRWLYSTRQIEMSPYNLQHYEEEIGRSRVRDYAIIAHAGHGVNSYAIHYYLVHGSLAMLLQLAWGGVYMDPKVEATKILDCFAIADRLVQAAALTPKLKRSDRLLLVGSDLYGSYWLPPGKSRPQRINVRNSPLKVLLQAFDWVL